jgi:ZIP family zinc transporter
LAEPIAGLGGVAAVLFSRALLPYALGFAAGAMIYVVVEEPIPESQRSGHPDLATVGLMLGFAMMMILAVAFT